jgi:hypothetical protein
MQRVVVGAMLVGSAVSFAQPPTLQVRTGIGFGRYSETFPGGTWSSELQPHALVGGEGALAAWRGEVVFQAQAALGIETHMGTTTAVDATVMLRENNFHQEIYEASPRYRLRLSPVIYVELGYRLLYHHLHFTEMSNNADENRDVTVHAAETGFGWRSSAPDGSAREIAVMFGVNRGSAATDRDTGDDGGVSANVRIAKRTASGLTIEAQYAYRKQNRSDNDVATQQWLRNTTWQLVAVFGYSF